MTCINIQTRLHKQAYTKQKQIFRCLGGKCDVHQCIEITLNGINISYKIVKLHV